jgi:hypothetical protein
VVAAVYWTAAVRAAVPFENTAAEAASFSKRRQAVLILRSQQFFLHFCPCLRNRFEHLSKPTAIFLEKNLVLKLRAAVLCTAGFQNRPFFLSSIACNAAGLRTDVGSSTDESTP